MNDQRTRLQKILRDEVAPALEMDGREIEVVNVEGGIASVRLGNICAGCSASVSTVVMQIESELRTRMPEIEMVEAVA